MGVNWTSKSGGSIRLTKGEPYIMTPKTISSSTILQAISEESMGFRFGKPERPNESSLACILPILRETSQVRQYITLPETEQVLVFDSGTINKVNLKNASKSNVFVRSGTILEGKGTQTRALMRSAVLFPGTEVALDVRCIHQTHGIRTGAEFKYGGITPLSVDSAVYSAGYRPQDQHATWNAVRRTTSSMRTMAGSPAPREVARPQAAARPAGLFSRFRHSSDELGAPVATEAPPQPASVPIPPTPAIGRIAFGPADDNLKQNFDEFARSFDAILSKARLQENQVGLALITDTGCKTVELFDLAASWEAIHKDAVKRMGTELLRGPDNTSVFEYKPENAVNAVRKVLGLTASRYVGEIVELDGRVIHLTILETAVA